MYKLVYASDYTTYEVDTYPSVEACAQDCQKRYGMRQVAFGQDDAGTLYTALYAEEGIVVLKLYEVDTVYASQRH